MLRWGLTRIGQDARLAALARRSATVRTVVQRYLAGETLGDGLRVAARLAADGAAVSLDHVGEHVTELAHAERAAEVYRQVLEEVGRDDLPVSISVKPTQLGLLVDPDHCAKLVADLADRAATAGVHVTLDMEDHTVTEATVRLVERAHADGRANVGCALQAALHRTAEDVRRLTHVGASLRLCKGAYAEPGHLAYRRRVEVTRSYLRAASFLLREGHEPRFATHDHRLVATIKRLAAELGRDRSSYEFQMLYGVRPELQRSLLGDGYRLRVYVPFGREWWPYFSRRLAERPANLAFFVRTLLDPGGTD